MEKITRGKVSSCTWQQVNSKADGLGQGLENRNAFFSKTSHNEHKEGIFEMLKAYILFWQRKENGMRNQNANILHTIFKAHYLRDFTHQAETQALSFG